MLSISDPVHFTTDILTLLSVTLSVTVFGAGYTSYCATGPRYQAVVALLDHWDDYVKSLTPEERVSFEHAQPGELDRISETIKRLRSGTAAMNVELDNHRWWRYFPLSEVCGEFRDWDSTIREANHDFYTTTERLRGTQRPSAMRAQAQAATAGTQGVPTVDRNRAVRWLNTVRAQLPDIRLRGIVDGLNVVEACHPHNSQLSWFLNASGPSGGWE
ncbi:hypothetical protein LXA43DRAFT_1066000 [Ganoderma leucocontextum]|nr:hypothetical protein LXA43DRAFT_1066000 [Ganoderma leucocontextum]